MRRAPFLAVATALAVLAGPARAQHPEGGALVRMLGPHASQALAPRAASGIGAIVRLPPGARASDLGLTAVAPGFARLSGSPARLLSFSDAHPDLPLEVFPPLHLLLDTAGAYVTANVANASGRTGAGALVGIADTGIDLTHPDFLDAQGGTRVAWLLDLSSPPRGEYPDLEKAYGTTDDSGNLVAGAVWAKADIDALLLAKTTSTLPHDEVGHGTLVAACAAANDPVYRGVAPAAGLLVARVSDAGAESIGTDELVRGASFLFNRADTLGLPVVVNLSLGTDFGPHDGSTVWEQALAAFVGPDHPGHALVAAAGNSGSIVDTPVHQNVYVSPSSTMRVPIFTGGSDQGGVLVWTESHGAVPIQVGLLGPDQGILVPPASVGQSLSKQTGAIYAGVCNGCGTPGGSDPTPAQGALVMWQGQWSGSPSLFYVTLQGDGTVDLYLQPFGDTVIAGARDVGFVDGVRESTVNLPATSPGVIGVGCTINKTEWTSVDHIKLGRGIPPLDAVGEEPDPDPDASLLDPVTGEPCWFSSAGPTLAGVPKPDILAPGAIIVGALSQQAVPPAATSIFTTGCPTAPGMTSASPLCQEVDALHGVSSGTSFSAPLVAGATAVLFQDDPTLTQDRILAALQGGAHPLRGPARFQDQAVGGELDVMGALTAAQAMRQPGVALPVRGASWMTLGGDVYLADGSTPLGAIVELRGAPSASGSVPPADGFDEGRLGLYALVDGRPFDAKRTLARRGPGVWVASVQLPAGLGGSGLTVGATFDGVDIVDPRTVPIDVDVWAAGYPPTVKGGCDVCPVGAGRDSAGLAGALLGFAAAWRRRRCARRS